MRRKAAAFPGAFSLEPLRRIWTVRQFDEAYTAPAPRLPRRGRLLLPGQRACGVIDRIRVPALILTAEDDPFVPVGSVPRSISDVGNPNITVVDHAARRALCVCGARAMTATTATGRSARSSGSSTITSATPDARISSRFANSGPFPSSSCLK